MLPRNVVHGNLKQSSIEYLYKESSLEDLYVIRKALKGLIKHCVQTQVDDFNNVNYYHDESDRYYGAKSVLESLIEEKIYLDRLIKKRKQDEQTR